MLKNCCYESGYRYCDNNNIAGPSFYAYDRIHLNTSKRIPTLDRNKHDCIENYYQPVHPTKHIKTLSECLLHFNRAKHPEKINSNMILFTSNVSTDPRIIMKSAMQTL